jgi:2-keto-4-pentenoate hydratase
MTKPKPTDPLTVEEMRAASEQFFPLFEVVHSRMPKDASVEDTLKVMENVAKLGHKLRAKGKSEGKGPFGFNKKSKEE